MQLASHARQWRILRPNGDAIFPVWRTDGDISRVAAGAALELRITNRDERSCLRHHVEMCHALRLRVAVMHQPGFALKIRRCVGLAGSQARSAGMASIAA